ncbi:hypothetical protein BKA70DRAFT_1269100 [Coprinopsis sp. MPI-PUGE-AT-0042]|nr:hypothetical protein BKA70DRAFT_1269100 [Coprinopsis sp. MPI-PUGE-AT-0042]
MVEVQEDLSSTYGALLLGGFISACFTGAVVVQTLIYYKVFPLDRPLSKLLVAIVCLLDMVHSTLVWSGIWEHLIRRPRTLADIDYIPLSISLSIVVTASLTFLVHLFFADRIYRLSAGKWHLTAIIIMLAAARLAFACVTSAQMIRLRSFNEFVEVSSWSFTLGLALSSAVDIIVTASLFFLLRDTVGPDTLKLGRIIDTLVRYTIEIGSVTCLFTIVSLICWLVMPHNLIFMGLHFVIGKLYANSLIATLNTRRTLRMSQRRLEGLDASRIVREDLHLHFSSQIPTSHRAFEGPRGEAYTSRILKQTDTMSING